MAPPRVPTQHTAQPLLFINTIISVGVTLCASWVLLYMLLAGNEPGRSFYAGTAKAILGDPKGGAPLLHLAVPILMAGSLISFGWTLPSPRQHSRNAVSSSRRNTSLSSIICGQRIRCIHRWRHRLQFVQGDWNLNVWAMTLLLVPSVVFLFMTMYRHLQGKELSADDQIMVTSNSFGMTSEVMGSLLLIPVSRYSSILQWMGWSPARAVRWHIWIGRIFIITAVVHGAMHMFRWKVLASERLVGMLIPPRQCWTRDNEQYTTFQPDCLDENTDCSCYDIFRNLTGFLSVAAMAILLLTSLQPVRRQCYRLFYISHVIAAPLALIMVVLHWNRSILFLAPSLLYYVASSSSTFVERRWQCSTNKPGVKIMSMERIPSSLSESTVCKIEPEKSNFGFKSRAQQAHYMSITVEATDGALQQFRPGYYVQLLAPEISSISHPFTINTVPGNSNQLRIIFKVIGQFTSQLSQRIQVAMPDNNFERVAELSTDVSCSGKLPQLHIHGYLGTQNRVGEVLCHDVAVMIAGGIGITPYLSLLHHVHDILSNSAKNTFPTKRVVLLWMCRDASLIEYVKREYLDPLLKTQQQQQDGTAANGHVDFKIKCIIYHTGNDTTHAPSYTDQSDNISIATESTLSLETNTKILNNQNNNDNVSLGVPFAPSNFATGSSTSFKGNRLGFLTFFVTSWVGLALTWWFYKAQAKKEVTSRAWGMLAMAGLGIAVAILANALARLPFFHHEKINEAELARFNQLPPTEEEEADGLVRDIEMEVVHAEDIQDVLEDVQDRAELGSSDIDASAVSLEEQQGRPTIHQMLQFVDNARRPGLFTCGPLGLMQDIREHTEERCMLRLQQCMLGASHHIAVYEEAFNM